MLAWGRLIRLSLAPSAAADVAAGLILAGAGLWPVGAEPWLLVLASLCIYHGGMALNDWADRAHDAATRPDRPIPSGAVPAGAALTLAVLLLAAGPALGFAVGTSSGVLLTALAAAVVAYDLAGRGELSGPALLGICRGLNLASGPVYLAGTAGHAAWSESGTLLVFPVVYAVYVFAVSLLGRLEDAPEQALEQSASGPKTFVLLAAFCLLVPAWLPVPTAVSIPAAVAAVGVSGWGAFGLVRLALAKGPWTRGRILGAMGAALRRLLIFTATCALVAASLSDALDGWIVAALILAGYPLSFALRKVFPPS